MKLKSLLPYAVLVVLAVAAGLYAGYRTFAHRRPPRPQTAAVLLHEAKPLPGFALTDTDGKPFTQASLAGHWSLLYFGYTHCPDACPTTLSDLAHMHERLSKLPAAEQPQVWFISVDPKRDDLKLLKDYTLYFDPTFTGATGSIEALRALTEPLGVDFRYDPADLKSDYSVTHSTFVVMVDPQGEEVALFSPSEQPAHMAADYTAILAYYGVQN